MSGPWYVGAWGRYWKGRHGALAAVPPIVQGCCSFAECIDSSVQYAHRLDIDAIEAVGHAQLVLGKGLDTHMMSEHAALVGRVGLTAALFEGTSKLLPVTLRQWWRDPSAGSLP